MNAPKLSRFTNIANPKLYARGILTEWIQYQNGRSRHVRCMVIQADFHSDTPALCLSGKLWFDRNKDGGTWVGGPHMQYVLLLCDPRTETHTVGPYITHDGTLYWMHTTQNQGTHVFRLVRNELAPIYSPIELSELRDFPRLWP